LFASPVCFWCYSDDNAFFCIETHLPLVYPKVRCWVLYCSWHTSTTCQRQQLHPRSSCLQMTALFTVLLTTRLTVTYCRLQF
jgi:hypothetical protein